MKIRLIIFFTCLLLPLLMLKADEVEYKFMYVVDKDMYVNVRESNDVKSAIMDTVYNLQIVQVESKKDKDWYKTNKGYIHQSRLVELPSYMEKGLSNYFDFWNSFDPTRYFVASRSCTDVVVCFAAQTERFVSSPSYDRYGKTEPSYILSIYPYDGHGVIYFTPDGNMKFIAGSIMIFPINRIIVKDDHLVLIETPFEYSYARNANNEICQYTLLYSANNTLEGETYFKTMNEARKVFRVLDKIIDKDYTNISEAEYRDIKEQLYDILQVNNFDFLHNLEQIYLSGDKEVAKYYHCLIYYFPKDGEGTHAIEPYFSVYYCYKYKGEVRVEDMDDINY